ncbi:hypothetical protein A1OE_1079 [Candidatus Endolissoclinum faulkneri L2]|uniref:Uncharacterized protein n=1 Tax=Candidatus Endolissoclinum faulkneri L2 TaxID=1193729 RepID=K7YNZ2_9PROT|nr:hypothetical protein A1OE_1079 [Candidatus Endolissoclinum faulkneri L2]
MQNFDHFLIFTFTIVVSSAISIIKNKLTKFMLINCHYKLIY